MKSCVLFACVLVFTVLACELCAPSANAGQCHGKSELRKSHLVQGQPVRNVLKLVARVVNPCK